MKKTRILFHLAEEGLYVASNELARTSKPWIEKLAGVASAPGSGLTEASGRELADQSMASGSRRRLPPA
jgi:hypothetical protein